MVRWMRLLCLVAEPLKAAGGRKLVARVTDWYWQPSCIISGMTKTVGDNGRY